MLSSYSYSSLDTYRMCPRKYKFAYIEKAPKDSRVNTITYLGSTVHRALQKLYTHGNDGVIIPLEDILGFYSLEWEKLNPKQLKVDSEYYTVDDYIRIGREMLEKFYNSHYPFKHGMLLGAELFLHFNLPGTPIRLKATIDRLTKYPDGTVEICDYKTGQHITRPEDLRFQYQMGIYQMGVQENYPQYEKIKLTQYFLRKEEEVSYEMPKEQLELLTEAIKQVVLETDYAERTNNFPTTEGDHCTFCDYYEICPAKKHRQLLEQQETEELSAESAVIKAKELTQKYIEQDTAIKDLKASQEQIKAELKSIADEFDMTVFESDAGKLSMKITNDEKFITKSDNARLFAELSALCRSWDLDVYFKLDNNSLMKDGVRKKMLSEDQLKQLEPYIKQVESIRVSLKKIDQDEIE